MLSNERNVFVAHANERKDLKAAEQYGKLRDVFGYTGRVYNTDAMLAHARRVLSDYTHGDSILMIGDPVLCGICIAVAAEFEPVVQTLSWDRNEFKYVARKWDFTGDADNVYPEA